jgi:peroxiredoxin
VNLKTKQKRTNRTMKGKVMIVLTLMALYANECSSSAIPMWEYLSRDEKVRVQASDESLKAILC